MAECKFSGGIEKANLILSTGILQKAWDSILDLQKTPQLPFSIKEFPKSTILAFDSQNQAQDFKDLDSLDQADPLGFLITKDNSSISLHRSPLSTFLRLLDDQHLKEQLKTLTSKNQPELILVGQSLGGSVAALFTLWLLKNRSSTSLPLCITFGSPFIGDAGLQKTITKVEQWKSQFWHVVGLPRLFVPSRPAALQVRSSCSQFKPFGTYFLISGSGCVCIDDPDSVLDLLDLTTPNLGGPDMDYGATLQQLKEMKRYRSNVEPVGLQGSSHRMGLALQLEAIGIGANHSKYAELLHAMERREQDVHIKRKSIPNLSKRLNEVKKQMACLEWYKKECEARNMNYYYKRRKTERDIDVTKFKNILTRYWEEKVKEVENKSQLPDFPMTTRFLYGGTTYRRMVEPLDIADHYRKRSSRDYTAKRSNHYKILEKWHEEERKDQKKKDKAPSITDDSCFWAQFEKAALKLDELKQGEVAGSKSELDLRKELIEFEGYVMMLVNNYELSPEVFLEHSGFMGWWEDYEEKLEPCYNSPFVSFMKSKGYLNYQ